VVRYFIAWLLAILTQGYQAVNDSVRTLSVSQSLPFRRLCGFTPLEWTGAEARLSS